MSKFRNFLKKVFLEDFFNDILFFNLLKKNFGHAKSVLELGAGENSYINFKNKDFHITALDLHRPSIEKSKKENNFNKYLLGDAREITTIFDNCSFDIVTSFDLLEHFEKDEGYQLLDDMTEVAKKKVIVYTPNGFVPQQATVDNPFQEHKSGWTYREMRKLGFKVYGVNGFKKLRGMYAVPKIKPRELGNFTCNISQVFLKLTGLNKLSYGILCVKDIR